MSQDRKSTYKSKLHFYTLTMKQQKEKLRTQSQGWPSGIVVKFARSASAAWGLQLWILGADLCTTQAMLWQHPTQKIEEVWHGYQLRANVPQAKKRGLAMDVSSGQSSSHTHTKKESFHNDKGVNSSTGHYKPKHLHT